MLKLFTTFILMWLFSIQIAYGQDQSLPLRGINFAGPGFGSNQLPGKNNVNYVFPNRQMIMDYVDFGFEVIRLSFIWERLQPDLNYGLNHRYLKQIDAVVDAAKKQHALVLLDLHNYGKYRGNLIGTNEVPIPAFEDVWQRLAKHYKNDTNVMFGLMNEPNKHDAETWAGIAQAGIEAIRKTGAVQTILVPGTYWSSTARWLHKDGQLSNGEALQRVSDPINNIIFEGHIYLDKYSSGTSKQCVNETVGVRRIEAFTNWLRQNSYKGFLGEFGVSKDPVCLIAMQKMLDYMDTNKDVWFGWTYWAASQWFGDYMFNIYPLDATKYPQLNVLQKYMNN